MLLTALALVVTWQVITRSFAAYLAAQAPEAALGLNSNDPVALLNIADARLNRVADETKGDASQTSATSSSQNGLPGDEAEGRIGAWAETALKAAAGNLTLAGATQPDAGIMVPGLAPPSVTEAEREEIRAQTEVVLSNDPLNARALRVLGQLADGAGDKATASKFMQAAVRRSHRETTATYWMMAEAVEGKDYDSALRLTDVFLRKRPQFMETAMPVLVGLAESKDKEAVSALKTLLVSHPPWRSSFLATLPKNITDARTPLQLLLSLKDSEDPPTTRDLRSYLQFLIGKKFYELAYYSWLQFLPPEQLAQLGLINNGGFEASPSGLPFDWVISQGSGVTVDIALRPGQAAGRALFLEFGPGRADFRGVSQFLLLAPGTYQLKGKLMGEIAGRRGLQWLVTCAGKSTVPIGESEMFLGTEQNWTDFEVSFDVPETDCRAQELRLVLAARSASERLVTGSIWYDELQLTRVEASKSQALDVPKNEL